VQIDDDAGCPDGEYEMISVAGRPELYAVSTPAILVR